MKLVPDLEQALMASLEMEGLVVQVFLDWGLVSLGQERLVEQDFLG